MNYRHEHKYIETIGSLAGIESRLNCLMKKDPHVSERGSYSVRSLYFDDYRDRFLNENIDGVNDRRKWRIRIYDRSADHISLEEKLRKGDLIAKRSCRINTETYESIIRKTVRPDSLKSPVFNLFVKEMMIGMLHPAVIVEYERTPFVCKTGNTRVTIDRNIRSSDRIHNFLSENILAARPVLESGKDLIEIKYDSFLPDHIASVIEHGRMRRESFSKYCLARMLPYNGIMPKY